MYVTQKNETIMNTTTITINNLKKFNQILNYLHYKKVSYLSSLTTNSITFFTNSTFQTNSLLSHITQLLHLTSLQPSYALAA